MCGTECAPRSSARGCSALAGLRPPHRRREESRVVVVEGGRFWSTVNPKRVPGRYLRQRERTGKPKLSLTAEVLDRAAYFTHRNQDPIQVDALSKDVVCVMHCC